MPSSVLTLLGNEPGTELKANERTNLAECLLFLRIYELRICEKGGSIASKQNGYDI